MKKTNGNGNGNAKVSAEALLKLKMMKVEVAKKLGRLKVAKAEYDLASAQLEEFAKEAIATTGASITDNMSINVETGAVTRLPQQGDLQ